MKNLQEISHSMLIIYGQKQGRDAHFYHMYSTQHLKNNGALLFNTTAGQLESGEKREKTSLFTDGIIYLENSADNIHTFQKKELNKFSKVAGNKIKAQKFVLFLYTNKN